jgi:hypothetical protein
MAENLRSIRFFLSAFGCHLTVMGTPDRSLLGYRQVKPWKKKDNIGKDSTQAAAAAQAQKIGQN